MVATVAVDFDGVLHAYRRGWGGGEIYDEPVPGALAALRALMKQYAVFVHTTRDPEPVAVWLEGFGFTCATGHSGPFWNKRDELLVTNRKLAAVAYIDDRAIRFTGDWEETLAFLDSVSVSERGDV